jgi:hypothetical protein
MLGKPVSLIVPKSQQNVIQDRLRRCLKGEIIRNVECVRLNKSGQEMQGVMTLSLLTDERGEAEAISMTSRHPKT